jgi:glutathione S-transferase
MSLEELLYPSLGTIIVIILYLFQSKNVARGRLKYNVPAPKTMGHNDNFDRIFRVHLNTLEQMPIFLPLLWIFAVLINPLYSFILSIIWSIGRIGYTVGYYKSAEGRHNLVAYLSDAVNAIFLFGIIWVIGGRLLGWYR